MIPQVRPSEFNAWLQQQPQRPVVLDVREPWEQQVAALSAGEFDLLAIPMNQLPSRLADLPQDRPIACLCHHGVRSQHVAMWLAHQGYTDVANIAGGIDAWSQESDPAVPRY